jgi:hypothetical protein
MVHTEELSKVCRKDKEQGGMVNNISIADID